MNMASFRCIQMSKWRCQVGSLIYEPRNQERGQAYRYKFGSHSTLVAHRKEREKRRWSKLESGAFQYFRLARKRGISKRQESSSQRRDVSPEDCGVTAAKSEVFK